MRLHTVMHDYVSATLSLSSSAKTMIVMDAPFILDFLIFLSVDNLKKIIKMNNRIKSLNLKSKILWF